MRLFPIEGKKLLSAFYNVNAKRRPAQVASSTTVMK